MSRTTTQLSAHIVTQKLMNNGMKGYFKYKIQKIKLVQIGVLINNTLYTHTHSHRYKIQTITTNTQTNLTFYIWVFIIF